MSTQDQDLERYLDEYDYYESLFDPTQAGRIGRRRKPRKQPKKKRAQWDIASELGDVVGLEGGFQTTYTPAQYEEGWLLSSMRTFYDESLITDILSKVKGGKEANVYCCQAHPSTGTDLLAAKVYRPRQFRNLRNDKMYREGRQILLAPGHAVHANEHRIIRALQKNTAFGWQVRHTSWLMHEYTTLETLYRAGAAVPQPFSFSDNAILMAYIGDKKVSAPTLHQIRLTQDQAAHFFNQVLRNVEIMLRQELIHGDLSAYNILYWEDDITLIDFPQVVNYQANRDAYPILQRDLKRICDYFSRQGLSCDGSILADQLWHRYATPDPRIAAAETYELIRQELEQESAAGEP